MAAVAGWGGHAPRRFFQGCLSFFFVGRVRVDFRYHTKDWECGGASSSIRKTLIVIPNLVSQTELLIRKLRNLADDDGRTPLHAVLRSHEEMAQFHRSQGNDLISRGFQIILEVLLDGGAEKNLADNFGRTPLHVAARQGNLALLHLILKARADPDWGDALPFRV